MTKLITHNNYYKSEDGEQIFFSTNFPHNAPPNGPVLVFNYGLVCSNHHWRYQLDYFASRYPVLIHDYRGHFNSSGMAHIKNITFHSITNDLKGIIDRLNLTQLILLGHSMGVNVTLEFTKRFRELVIAQVLIGGSVMPVSDVMLDSNIMGIVTPTIKKLLKNYPKPFSFFWKSGGKNPLVKKIIHREGFNVQTVSEEFIEIYLNKIGQLAPELFFQLFDQMATHDVMTYLPEMKTKTLVMAGAKDKVFPLYLQRSMQELLPNSEFFIISDGSHVPQVDFPEIVNSRIDRFVQENFNLITK